ncbi:trace amine-associated receptor 7e-like [Oculina patagonica]
MDLNDTTKTTGNSSAKDRSVFYCPKQPDLTWDLDETTFPWVLVGIKSFASLVTIFLNALVILIVKQKREFQKNSYILLSSLAVADLIVGAVTLPFSASIDLLLGLRVSLEYVCTLDIVNVYSMYCVSWCALYHLTAVAWERYVAIGKSIEYLSIVTRSRITKLAITVWLSAIFTTIPPLIMEVVGVDMSFVQMWITGGSICGALSLMAMVYFYVKVYLGVRKRKLDQISQVTVLIQAKQEVKVAKTTGLLAVALMISFFPGIVVSSSASLRTSTGIRVSELLMQLSSLVNPLLYCYRNRRFTNAALELLRMKKAQEVQPAPGAMRSARRKDQAVGSLQNALDRQQNPTKPPRFIRSASCDQIDVGVDCGHRRFESPTALRRSMSDPLLAQCSSSSDGSRTQQPWRTDRGNKCNNPC